MIYRDIVNAEENLSNWSGRPQWLLRKFDLLTYKRAWNDILPKFSMNSPYLLNLFRQSGILLNFILGLA